MAHLGVRQGLNPNEPCKAFRCRSKHSNSNNGIFPDGKTQTIRAYREEAHALREFIRRYELYK
jgi:hypothetical protein